MSVAKMQHAKRVSKHVSKPRKCFVKSRLHFG